VLHQQAQAMPVACRAVLKAKKNLVLQNLHLSSVGYCLSTACLQRLVQTSCGGVRPVGCRIRGGVRGCTRTLSSHGSSYCLLEFRGNLRLQRWKVG